MTDKIKLRLKLEPNYGKCHECQLYELSCVVDRWQNSPLSPNGGRDYMDFQDAWEFEDSTGVKRNDCGEFKQA